MLSKVWFSPMITTTCLMGVVVVASPAFEGDVGTAGAGADADAETELGNAASAAPPARTAVRHRPRRTGMKRGVLIDDLLSPKREL
jgi:hypothetical protein